MDKTTYKSIRGEKDFLCRYFNKESGMNLNSQTFATYLSMWIMSMGTHPQQGINMILNFLDEKYK